MTRSIALSLLVLLGLSLAPESFAAEPMIKIASGRKGFTYRTVYAVNLEKLMRGYKFVYLPSEGSGQNLELLASGKANVAFAQADVYAVKRAADPERFEDIVVIGRIAPECVYIAHRKEGPVKTLDELAAKATAGEATIAVGAASSGMSGTWAFLRERVAGLEKVKIDHTKGTLALNQLEVGAFDAVGWVTDPDNPDQKMLRAALANDRLGMMPLALPALFQPLADGTRIYEPRTVELGEGQGSEKVDTVCTSAMLFARKDVGTRTIDKLADVVSLQLDQIVPKVRHD